MTTICAHCHQPYTGTKADHLIVCHAVTYQFNDDFEFGNLDNGSGEIGLRSARYKKNHKRGKMQKFGKAALEKMNDKTKIT